MEHFNLINRLHTDVLEEKYGKIRAVVLRHDSKIREAHLADANSVSRTYAITFLNKTNNEEISKINEQIKNGGAIGKAFREFGFSIRKNVIDTYVIKIPDWLKKAFKTKSKYAKARLSEFYAAKANQTPMIYGTVVEIYAPDFRVPVINEVDKKQINPLTREFEKIGVSKKEVWNRIGADNDWKDLRKKYAKAKKNSKDDIKRFKEKIKKIMKK